MKAITFSAFPLLFELLRCSSLLLPFCFLRSACLQRSNRLIPTRSYHSRHGANETKKTNVLRTDWTHLCFFFASRPQWSPLVGPFSRLRRASGCFCLLLLFLARFPNVATLHSVHSLRHSSSPINSSIIMVCHASYHRGR